MHPPITNFYSTITVFIKTCMLWIMASLSYGTPNFPFRRPASIVSNTVNSNDSFFKMATRFCFTTSKAVAKNYGFIAATTYTIPSALFSCFVCCGFVNNSEFSKDHSNHIFFRIHNILQLLLKFNITSYKRMSIGGLRLVG